MSIDEMSEAFVDDNPGYFPTKQAVGRYAKRIGYRLTSQKINKKQHYFYIRRND